MEPQITVGLLTDAAGFPLMVEAFEGNRAETKTMIPTITAFMAAHQLRDVTVVADAGMVSEANQRAIEAAGVEIADGQVFTQPWPTAPPTTGVTTSSTSTGPTGHGERVRDRRAGRQGAAGRGREGRGETEPVHTQSGATKRVNRQLEAKARALGELKGYVTNIPNPSRSW